MSDCDSEVFCSGDEDSDVYSHSNESRHFGAPESSNDPADLSPSTGSLNSSPDAQYHHAESDGSMNFTDHSLESPTEMWDSDNRFNEIYICHQTIQTKVRAQGLLMIITTAQTQMMKSLLRPHVGYVNHTFGCFVKAQRLC